jgi:WD40 repeat protein
MVVVCPSSHAQDVPGTSLPEGAIARVGNFQLRHQAAVHQLTFLPNGFLTAVDTRGCFRVWDPSTGLERRQSVLPGRQGDSSPYESSRRVEVMGGQIFIGNFRTRDENGPPVPQEAVSPDGRILAIANLEKVVLHDTTTGKVVRQLELTQPKDREENLLARLRSEFRTPLAFSADGKYLAAGNGILPGLQVFDVNTGKQTHELHPPRGRRVFRLLFVPSMTHLVGHCGDLIAVWDLKSGKRIRTYVGTRETITAMAVSQDGRRFATAHEGGHIRFWDDRSEEETGSITNEGPNRSIQSLAFSPDGGLLAAGDSENNLRLYDAGSLKESKLLNGHQDTIAAIAFSADGKLVASGDVGGRIRIWDIARGKETLQIDSLHAIQHVAVQGQKILLGGANGVVRHADLLTGKVLQRFKGPEVSINPVFSPDAKLLAYYIPEREAPPQLWDAVNEKALPPLKGVATATSFVFSPDGRRLMLSHGDENTLQMWDPRSGEMLSVLGKNSEALAFSPDGRTLLIEEAGGSLGVWELAAGKARLRVPGMSIGKTLALSPNGRQVANATSEIIRLWSLTNGKVERALASHTAQVNALAYSPDGTRLASGDRDGGILLWDLTRFQPLQRYLGHRDGVNCLAFSADGKVLVSGSTDGTAVVWDLETAANPVRREAVKKLEALWAELASEEAEAAYAAQNSLIAQGDAAVAQLRKGLSPVPAVAPAQIHALIADLNDRRFAVREKAMQELTRLEGQAAPALKQVLETKPSSEIVKRARALLDIIAKPVAAAEMLRQLRAVEVLERIQTAQARQLLQELAKGAAGARLTEEAKSAVERLNARPSAPSPR